MSKIDLTNLRGRRVTVMGLGRFGGGIGAVNYLLRRGALVTLTDLLAANQLATSLGRIQSAELHGLVLGEHRDQDFTETDLLVVNPAVKPGNRFVEMARQRGVPVLSEMNLFWQVQRGQIIAVTGTVGKSTTAALIAHILRVTGRDLVPSTTIRLGGNIGVSLLEEVESIRPTDWTVLEVSSFQLELLAPLQPRPNVAVVTNVYPNHLDWHGTMEAYCRAKQRLVEHQTAADWAVFPGTWNGERPLFSSLIRGWPTAAQIVEVNATPTGTGVAWAFQARDGVLSNGDACCLEWEACLPGPHNRRNVTMALAVCSEVLRRPLPECLNAIKTFRPLPHRLEFVAEVSGRRFYNDSKATTPEAACEALQAFHAPLHLIAGGADKGVDLTHFATLISRHVASVAFIGTTAPQLAELVRSKGSSVQFTQHNFLRDAFGAICQRSRPGDVILLSPGCASFGEFTNYEDRGEKFRQLVMDHLHALENTP